MSSERSLKIGFRKECRFDSGQGTISASQRLPFAIEAVYHHAIATSA